MDFRKIRLKCTNTRSPIAIHLPSRSSNNVEGQRFSATFARQRKEEERRRESFLSLNALPRSAILKRAGQKQVGGPWTDPCQGNIQHLSTGSRVAEETSHLTKSAWLLQISSSSSFLFSPTFRLSFLFSFFRSFFFLFFFFLPGAPRSHRLPVSRNGSASTACTRFTIHEEPVPACVFSLSCLLRVPPGKLWRLRVEVRSTGLARASRRA